MERLIHTDIRTNPDHRELFYDLTQIVFGFDLQQWYELGFWTPKYRPHAYIEDGRMVANVSAYDMRLVIAGQEHQAVQIGTVMTHPDYRGRGYASELMEHVVERKAADADLMFLFTSPHLIPFYQQSGFEVVRERRYLAEFPEEVQERGVVTRLDPGDAKTMAGIYARAKARLPLSDQFAILDGPEIFMFHCLYRYRDCIYRDETLDCLLIARRKDDVLHIYDILSSEPVNVAKLLSSFSGDGIKSVEFHFVPDRLALETRVEPFPEEDVFMVRGAGVEFPNDFRHQTTMQA